MSHIENKSVTKKRKRKKRKTNKRPDICMENSECPCVCTHRHMLACVFAHECMSHMEDTVLKERQKKLTSLLLISGLQRPYRTSGTPWHGRRQGEISFSCSDAQVRFTCVFVTGGTQMEILFGRW